MEPRGLSPTHFLSKVDPQFLCPICHLVARGPVVCSHCSTVYCSLCLPRQKCPSCSSTRFEPLSGVALKMYNGLAKRCRCGKEVTLGEWERHEGQCREGGDKLSKMVAELTSENLALKRENQALREEVATLRAKGGKAEAGAKAEAQQPRKRAEMPQKVLATPPPKAAVGHNGPEESKDPAGMPTPQGDKRPQLPPQPTDKRPPQPLERRPSQAPDKPPQADKRPPSDDKKPVPEATMNQAAMTIQRAFRMKKARELRAALQEKRAERMQHTGFKKKRNEAMAAFKNVQQVVQNLNIPAPKVGAAGKEGVRRLQAKQGKK